ncbi:Uncharacterised protein [Mycobacterium tuberculosis]|nr:Uncharacterised protein [Mycobacterium tuberculosis]COZ10657.1 Uncharacterised protein [Mycobacterium tuberculosis]
MLPGLGKCSGSKLAPSSSTSTSSPLRTSTSPTWMSAVARRGNPSAKERLIRSSSSTPAGISSGFSCNKFRSCGRCISDISAVVRKLPVEMTPAPKKVTPMVANSSSETCE